MNRTATGSGSTAGSSSTRSSSLNNARSSPSLKSCSLSATESSAACVDATTRVGLSGVVESCGGLVATVQHAYSHFRVTVSVYRCRIVKGEPQPKTHSELRWVAKDDFAQYPFPKANHKFLQLL